MDKSFKGNKLIVKNSIFLNARLFLTMLISLYSSRLLLQELGVADFGLYNLVGGIVAVFSSLRGLFSNATQRFLNFEMGKNNPYQLQRIFNMSILIHVIICLLFFLLAEFLGVWFLENNLVIAPERLSAARWVLQFSILASMVGIMTIPFDAVIIAHERFTFFACISILDYLLKLSSIFIIVHFGFDKLKLYALLIFFTTLIVRVSCIVYCKKNFQECRYKYKWDKTLFREMASFSGWNFLGNLGYSATNEGVNFLLNIFGGTVANGARGIAYQIKAAILMLLGNVTTAVRPQAIQHFAQGRTEVFFFTLYIVSKIIFFLFICILFPVFLFTESILQIWLGQIPDYTVAFIKTIILTLVIRSFHDPLDMLFMSAGKMKRYQCTELFLFALNIPVSWLLLKLQFQLYSVFIAMLVIEFANYIAILLLASKECGLNIKGYTKSVLYPCLLVFTILSFIFYIAYLSMPYPNNTLSLIISIGTVFFVCLSVIWLLGLSHIEKNILIDFVRKLALRRRK